MGGRNIVSLGYFGIMVYSGIRRLRERARTSPLRYRERLGVNELTFEIDAIDMGGVQYLHQ